MTPSLRFVITLALLGFASMLPATVGAQCPIYITQWGSFGPGDGQFSEPVGVATDAAGNVYVADRYNDRIQKFTGAGTYLLQWGSHGPAEGSFIEPQGVATDAAGDVYVADTGMNRIQKFTSTGTFLTMWGSSGTGNGQFLQPVGVATDTAGDVYVMDPGSHRIKKFTSTGAYLTRPIREGGDGVRDGVSAAFSTTASVRDRSGGRQWSISSADS